MYRPRYERLSRLRRFVVRRGKGESGDLASLIAEATRQLLLPSLRDVLNEGESEPVELRLTYGAACVVLAELLAHRFARRQAQEVAAGAIRKIGVRTGLDEALLTTRASELIRQLMETHPEVYRSHCDQFDAAIERAIVMARPDQGEVMLRLALEAFETTIQQLVLGGERYERPVSLIKGSGLLGVVRQKAPEDLSNEAQAAKSVGREGAAGWSFRLPRLTRRQRRGAPAPRR